MSESYSLFRTPDPGPKGWRYSDPDRIAWPPGRFEYRPNGKVSAPVLRCNACGETFSGWPGTYSHGIKACLWRMVR